MKIKPDHDPADSLPVQSESQMLEAVVSARAEGRILKGPVTARVASDDEMADAEVEAEYLARLRRAGDSSVPVTIRMPADLMIKLRTAADRVGVPYQAMIKNMIQQQLEQSAMVTVSELEKAIEPLKGLYRSKLQASGGEIASGAWESIGEKVISDAHVDEVMRVGQRIVFKGDRQTVNATREEGGITYSGNGEAIGYAKRGDVVTYIQYKDGSTLQRDAVVKGDGVIYVEYVDTDLPAPDVKSKDLGA